MLKWFHLPSELQHSTGEEPQQRTSIYRQVRDRWVEEHQNIMKIPVKFPRMAAAFDEAARVKSCESSGSEHSADLSHLVNSFLERGTGEERNWDHEEEDRKMIQDEEEELEIDSTDFGYGDLLKSLFDLENDTVKMEIHTAVEKARRELGGGGGESSPSDFKRRLMARLRDLGFDAGLCKSKWEKNGRCPPGEYEYVDVNSGGARYIVEVFLAGEFTIARAMAGYASLLENFPGVFVGKPEEIRQVVRTMCSAVRKSMKSAGISVPPWRRQTYTQNKWFGPYRRTTNEVSSRKSLVFRAGQTENQKVGFLPINGISFNCRENFAVARGDGRVRNLTAALQ